MSCIMLSDKLYKNVTRSLQLFRRDPKHYYAAKIDVFPEQKWYEENASKRTLGNHLLIDVSPLEFLVSKWVRANDRAYKERYPNHDDGDYFETPNLSGGAETSLCQLLKYLQAIDYQCSDWSGWQDSWEGKYLGDIVKMVTLAIMESLPEYQAAKWATE